MAALTAIASLASTAIGVAGAIQQGRAAEAAAEYEAQSREVRAKEEVAAAQRQSYERREQAKRLGKRQRAVAASSGGGAQSPSVLQIYQETAERGEYLAASDLYGGKSRARGQRDAAQAALMKGDAAKKGSFLEAAGVAASGIGSFARAYG